MPNDPFAVEQEGSNYKFGKLVGGYVPRHLAEYIRLLAVYQGVTTQNLLEQMIEYWHSIHDNEDTITEVLADRAYQEWVRRKKEDPALHFNTYRNEIRKRLEKRKISKETITDLLTRVNKKRKVGEW